MRIVMNRFHNILQSTYVRTLPYLKLQTLRTSRQTDGKLTIYKISQMSKDNA